MNPAALKQRIQQRLWEVAEAEEGILSATLTGSFLDEPSLDAISDIDLVVIVERLNAARFERLVAAFDRALRGELAARGFDLKINPTLGPLKFNDPSTAVLHLMLYSCEAHVEHALNSPFTCFNWQRSQAWCRRSLADVFPVFGLQPRHFMSARRGLQDYLRDFRAGVVSYRELVCTADDYREQSCTQPMSPRDRHEFTYHILRFLMHNVVMLVRRGNAPEGDALLDEYFEIFPQRQSETRCFFEQLRAKKRNGDFDQSLPDLDHQLETFVEGFEAQFRRMFFAEATRHVALRHGPTAANLGERVFLGSSDPSLEPLEAAQWLELAPQLADLQPCAAYSSPMLRCRQTLSALGKVRPLPHTVCDPRLREIDYGELEGVAVAASRATHAGLFQAWQRGEDPNFPGGENTHDVLQRALSFVDECWGPTGDTITCAHNVVLRCLIGHVLGLPPHQWHRLAIPHLAPVTFIRTRSHGLFVDIPNETCRTMFHDFATLAAA